MKMRRSSSSKRSAGVFLSSPTQFCAAIPGLAATSATKSSARIAFTSLEGFFHVDVQRGVVAGARDVDAEIDPGLLGREPTQAEARARQIGFLAHGAERARHLSRAGKHHRAEAAGERKTVLGLRRRHRAVTKASDLVAAQVAARAVEAEVEERRALGGLAKIGAQREHARTGAAVVVPAQIVGLIGELAAESLLREVGT